jgi:hypothetical protein
MKSFTCSDGITVVFERRSPTTETSQIFIYNKNLEVDHRYKIYQGATANLDPDQTPRIIYAYNGGFEPSDQYAETQVKEEFITS